MSEVKRYDMCGFGGGLVERPEGAWYHMDDFDRVTAECDGLQISLNTADQSIDELNAAISRRTHRVRELEALLTAADERVDVLEGLLRKLWHVVPNGYKSEIDAALKPAEVAKCERCGCSTVETCDERGCGYLGAGNGAPE